MNIAQCQSCGMPLADEVRGTEKDGTRSEIYCQYCYEDGHFTRPEQTLEGMIETCIPYLAEQGMPNDQARALLNQSLPSLKRWKDTGHDANTTAAATAAGPDRMTELAPLSLAGVTVRTSNAAEMGPEAKISGLWAKFWAEEIAGKLGKSAEPPVIYGCYAEYESDVNGAYTLMIGIEQEHRQGNMQDVTTLELPASHYAVFQSRTGPLPDIVIETWQRIWKYTEEHGLERTYTGDFERYDERSANPENAQVDIYIAVKAPAN